MRANTPEKIIAELVRTESGCWEWPKNVIGNGYGQVRVRGRMILVHRLVYEHLVGPIPNGYDLHHRCENRRCAEPAHLTPLSRREHTRLGRTIIAANVFRTHCLYGHPLDGVSWDKKGRAHRFCRECHRRINREYERRRGPRQRSRS